jgi:REP element-mobilizing transposase RayT
MAIKLTQSEQQQTYFCTFTCLEWIHLFEIVNLYDEIYNWFSILNNRKHQITGFVIMPNHLHLLIHISQGKDIINSLLANGKRFLAYEIIKRLNADKRDDILSKLAGRVTADERQRQKKHRVFEISSDIKPCYTEKFLLQKLEYIHSNPVSGKWQLSKTGEEYFHSSAGFYELNEEHPKVKITHYKDLGQFPAGQFPAPSPSGDGA